MSLCVHFSLKQSEKTDEVNTVCFDCRPLAHSHNVCEKYIGIKF